MNELVFREAIAHFATGVTVITTRSEGKPAGMTASAVASLSLDPVLLLVCVSTALPTHRAIESSRRFVVNVLGAGQEELAHHVARPSSDKFAQIALKEGHELPVLEDAIAHFVCDVHERFPGGDHTIFTGQVRECGTVPGKRPLVYFRSRFGSIRDHEAEFLAEAVGWDVGSLGGIASARSTCSADRFRGSSPAASMEYTIEIGGDPPGVTFTTSGRADLASILRANAEFLADPRFRPGMPILADHSALDTTSLPSSDARLIGDAYRQFLDRIGESAIAIVVAHPATFGLVRMAEAYAGPPQPHQRIFYSRAEAIDWLRDPLIH